MRVEHTTFALSSTAILLLRPLEVVRSEFFGVGRPFNGPAMGRESNAFAPVSALPGTDNTQQDSQLPAGLPEFREALVETSANHEAARMLFRPAAGSPSRQAGYVRGGVE